MTTKEKYIERARAFLGVVEGTPRHKEILKAYNSISPLPRGYSLVPTDSWCAGFVSAVAHLTAFGDKFPYECSVAKMVEKAKKLKIWVEGKNPKAGWLVVYDWQKDGHPDHVGIVAVVNPKTIKVIEGNYSDAVRIRTINKDSEWIKGYIALKFSPSGLKSNEEIAREVVAGKWGNGDERKKKLKKAGYNAAAIQKIVNKMMK